jgi:ubiquinone/menaquinone biosynthesis C-methylase UbiE
MATPPEDLASHYSGGYEAERLSQGPGRLEKVRTQELIRRFLPPPPAVILDVGGGTGVYGCWLATLGYEVHLVDAVPLHVDLARKASQSQPRHPLTSVAVGDARDLNRGGASADAVLMLGPLYHLTERSDRLAALAEGRRVLREGGVLLAAAISRFASVLDGLQRSLVDDPYFIEIVLRDLKDGQHRNPRNVPDYFMSTYFHHPGEVGEELKEAGLRHEATIAVEGPGWLLDYFDRHWEDPARRERLLEALRWIEQEPSLLGVSSHLMGVGRKK